MTGTGDPDPPSVARVVPNVSGLDKYFDYLVPEHLRDQVRVGTRVRVPLAGRRVGGWVVGIETSTSAPDPHRLKPIALVSGHGPAPEVVDLCAWTARRYAGPLRAVLASASPERALRRLPEPDRTARPERAVGWVRAAKRRGGAVLRRPPASDQLDVVVEALALGPLLVVHPSRDRGRVLAARLRALGRTVAVLPDDHAAAAGGVDVVIGARAAALGPAVDIGAVVVLDEHDESLQEERSPTWHARDVAIERARRAGIPCVLVSSVPSLAALAWADDRVAVASRVDERAGWPIVEIVDRGDELPWVTSLVGSRLIGYLRDPDRTVVCVHNMPGRARRLACRACRELTVCERCAAAVRQADDSSLRCDRCATSRPPVCQHCGSGALVSLRPGVARLREELEAAAGRRVLSVVGTDVEPPDLASARVVVGTEAVLHRVRVADVVAFVDFDAELLAPRYRAGEQALGLLARAASLVGGRSGGGRLLVQTRLPLHPVLDAAVHADPGRIVAGELATRGMLRLPPVTAIAVISGAGRDELAERLRDDGVVEVAAGAERVLVRAGTADLLADALARVGRPSGSRVRIEVDPPRI